MKKVTIYAVVVCLVGWALTLIYRALGGGVGFGYQAYGMFYMFLPTLVALLMRAVGGKGQRGCNTMLRFRPCWSWAVAIGLAIVSVFISLGLSSLFVDVVSYKEGTAAQLAAAGFTPEMVEQNMAQISMIPDWAMLLSTIFSGIVAGVTINALFAFGEEYGWRCYMVAEMAEKRFLPSALFIGAVWGIWHAPLILLYGHNYPTERGWGVAMMVLFCVAAGIVELYFVLKSGSVWPAVFIHGTINALAGITVVMQPGVSPLLFGYQGVAGVVSLLIVAFGLYLWDRFVSHDNIFSATLGESLERNVK